MSYNTPTEFKTFAYPSGSYNTVADATIQYYLDSAHSLINSSLQRYHQLPLDLNATSEIAFVKQGEIAIAAWNLISFIGTKPNFNNEPDTVLQQKATEWLDPEDGFLAKFSKGHLRLQPTADSTPLKQEGRAKLYGNPSRIRNRIV